ncbi:YggS family pyridoxal phosphate-dependent enzyme [Nakamurella sp. YIM 132087]|uniref:Pyridoxal phosphate homeostasis protein n=1 Tax=Nakamurella alba TaxID=2665158 RepID=A0A7K1FJB3_9ACTN|nr:YggS family pyridoxal phosphate-dependent enzyme [Nakamurella alba]
MPALAGIDRRIRVAAEASGRAAADVRLLIATKTVPAQRILPVLAAGYRLIGENRVQEVTEKADELAAVPHELHFIGHLQRNKINQLLPHISCLQTLDSADLAAALHSRLDGDRTLDVLLQVNVSGEASKSGIAPEQIPDLLQALTTYPKLVVRGYMTIGLNSADAAAVQAGYRTLVDWRDRAQQQGMPGAEHAVELSMGMSGDYESAIACGATVVRLGSSVFGARANSPESVVREGPPR